MNINQYEESVMKTYNEIELEHTESIRKLEHRIKQLESDLLISRSTPMQPMINGRFKENKIVSYCLDNNTDMNDIAIQGFSREDKEQFAQLIGYSFNGYGELSYVSDESYARAAKEFE